MQTHSSPSREALLEAIVGWVVGTSRASQSRKPMLISMNGWAEKRVVGMGKTTRVGQSGWGTGHRRGSVNGVARPGARPKFSCPAAREVLMWGSPTVN
jgi:hypothetical protein